MEKGRKITIYTQAYKTEAYLERCINSVLAQTYTNFEYILLDNASPDRCGEIIDRYAASDPRIIPVHFEQNSGGRELTLRRGTGYYFTTIDSDDWWDDNYLERLVRFLEENDLDLAITGTINYFEENGLEKVLRKLDAPVTDTIQQFAQNYQYLWTFPSTIWGSIMKMDIYRRTDWLTREANIPYGIDTLCMLRYLTLCNKIGIHNSAMYHYRIHQKSITYQYNPRRFDANIVVYEEIRDFLVRHNTFDAPKQEWLKAVLLAAMSETLRLLYGSQLSVREKIAECLRIARHPLTAHALTLECDERRSWHQIMRMIITQAAGAIDSDEDAGMVRDLLGYISPDCMNAFRLEYIRLYAAEPDLWQALLENDHEKMRVLLLELIAQKKHSKQFDLGALVNALLPDSCLLKGETDTRFYRTYGETCRLLMDNSLEAALEQMTGVLLDNDKLYAEDRFLNLYLSIAALHNQISAFLYGNIRLAYLCFNEGRLEECRGILRDLEEMGAGEHDDVLALRQVLEESGKSCSAMERRDAPPTMGRERAEKKSYCQLPSQPPLQTGNELWAQYSELTARGMYCIGAWLKQNGFRRVAVCCKPVQLYGMGFQFGTLDKLVISELNATDGVEVVGLITQTATTLGNIPIVSLADVKADPSIDAIIVSYPEIYESALHHLGNRVVFLHKIIRDIYLCQVKVVPLIQTLHDLQENGHQALVVCTPCAEDIEDPSEWEKFVVRNQIIAGGFGQEQFPEAFELSGLKQKYGSIAEYYTAISGNVTQAQGFAVNKNYYVEKLLIDGKSVTSRYVVGCPENYERTIYMFGNSAVAGIGLEESDSSPSALQFLCNKNGIAARVLNLGVDGQDFCQVANRISDSRIEKNSVVVVVMCLRAETQFLLKKIFEDNHIPFCATIESFQRPHQMGEVFFNAHHLNHVGNRKISELIFQEIVSRKGFSDAGLSCEVQGYQSLDARPMVLEEYYDPIVQSKEFREYIHTLSQKRKCGYSRIGAVVMNCNPFTLGHQYLVETCASKVDWLYVFVVQEDRSDFPFVERLHLVEQGVAHLANVSVLPSGAFMISSLTFPEYFRKDDLQELNIDPSADVELFGKYIAPALGITVRFAGNEPLDAVTNQYNETMEKLLPQFGIEFQVIRRKELGGAVISASRVRELLAGGEFEEIKKLVPPKTMDYLIETYRPKVIAETDQ